MITDRMKSELFDKIVGEVDEHGLSHVRSFGDLHDHCDANMLGYSITEEWFRTEPSVSVTEALNEVQVVVDRKLEDCDRDT